MALRTQTNPYVLVGNIADLPDPGQVAQGILFHAEDTLECRILVIDSVTRIRRWDNFCGAMTGATGPVSGPALLKFAGGGDGAGGPFYVADDAGVLGSAAPIGYPLVAARTARNFIVFLRQNVPGVPVRVDFRVNSVAVLSVTFPGGTGVLVAAGTAAVPAVSAIDVLVTPLRAATGPIAVSSTIELV